MSIRPLRSGLVAAIVGHRATAWAVLLLCLIVTAMVWRTSVEAVELRATERFTHEVDQAGFVVGRRLLVFERMLLGVHGLFEVDGVVSRQAWSRYVGALRLPEYYPGVKGAGFLRWVPGSDKAAYEARVRREGVPGFTVTPLGTRDAHAVVEYLEPLDSSNVRALGYDTFSEPRRRSALERARDSGLPTLSNRVVLVAQQGSQRQQPAVIMFVPQYHRGLPTETVEQRRQALSGWIYSPLLMDDLMTDIREGLSSDIAFQLFDGDTATPEALLFDTDSVEVPAPSTENHPPRTEVRSMQHAGRTWTLRARARPSFEEKTASSQPMLIAVGGLALDGTIFALFWSLAGLRRRAEHLAEEMTESSRRTVKALEREFVERGQAEAALREAEARLRLSVAASNVGLWDWDLTTGKVYFSPEWKAQLGYLDHELPSRFEEWERRLHPEDREPTLAAAKRFIEEANAHYAVEFRLQHKDGSYRWIFTQGQVYRSDAGQPLRMIGCHIDISDRKRAEADLRSDAAFRRAVIEQVSEGLCVCHVVADAPYLVFTVWNARMGEITGYTMDEINRRGWYEVMFPDPGDRAKAVGHMMPLQRGDVLEAEEWEITRADGERRVIALSARVLESASGEAHIMGLMRDITDNRRAETLLRESEQRFRELAENIQEVFWVRAGGNAPASYVSPAFEAIWGRPADTVYGGLEGWMNTLHPDDVDCALTSLRGETAGECEYRVIRPDGSIRWVRDRAFPIRDGAGELVRVVGVAEDVTARKLAEEERERMDERLRQGQKMEAIGTLAGGIAHDFNNILGAIVANVDLAQQDAGPDHPAAESLQQIYQSSQRAASLVQQILAFSRKRPQERRLVDLRTAVTDAVRLLRAPIPSSVELRTTIDEDIPPILADPTEIDQVLMNLCTNAWHALEGRPGDIHITLEGVALDAMGAKAHAELRPGRYVRLAVSDTGKGMSAYTRERIFDPFFTTKDVGQGTGLGLSVVHGIVTNLRGAITVASQPGSGTTFEVFFPAVNSAPAASTHDTARPATAVAGQGQRVLFLDDEEPLVTAGARILQRRGYQVTGCTNPTEALAVLRERPDAFDVVVADYNMPGASGIDVARAILALGGRSGMVLASGLMTEALRHEAADVGIHRLLYKPYSGDELVEAVHDVLGLAQKAA